MAWEITSAMRISSEREHRVASEDAALKQTKAFLRSKKL